MAFLDKVFQAAVNFNASDIHVTPGEPFIVRRLGRLVKMKSSPLSGDQTRQLIFEILSDDQQHHSSQCINGTRPPKPSDCGKGCQENHKDAPQQAAQKTQDVGQ